MKITCFLPCRKGSERVPRKNIRSFCGKHHGLLQIKLTQLLATRHIDQVILSTNDEEILDYASSLNDSRLDLRRRDDALARSATSTDELIEYAASQVSEGHVLWTHVTSPFVAAADYDEIVARYQTMLAKGYDSLMTVTPLQGFLWDSNGPMNYDRQLEKWPRTQTLQTLYEINSAAFIAPLEVYQRRADRIGEKPYKFELDKVQGFDIDWEDDFKIAEALLDAGVAKI